MAYFHRDPNTDLLFYIQISQRKHMLSSKFSYSSNVYCAMKNYILSYIVGYMTVSECDLLFGVMR